jgi:RimJ/RimL family protein N-acetyltransferase
MTEELHRHFLGGYGLLLREVRPEDAGKRYYNWMNDEDITGYTESRFYPYSLDQIKQYVQKMDGSRDAVFLAIIEKESGKHIGNIKIGNINWIHRVADVGIIIGEKQCWGKGYATGAIRLVCDYALNKLNLHKLWAGCYENNIGSIKAFTKAGFVREGVLREHYYYRGKYINGIILGRILEQGDGIDSGDCSGKDGINQITGEGFAGP